MQCSRGYFVHCVQRGALLDKSTQVASRSLVFRKNILGQIIIKSFKPSRNGLGGGGSSSLCKIFAVFFNVDHGMKWFQSMCLQNDLKAFS